MALEKVTIKPLKPDLESTTGEIIEAMYNPAEISIETSNQYQRTAIPGLPTPLTQFVSGQTQVLSFDLFFDTYEKGVDVREYTSKVVNLLKINEELHAPPVVQVVWGGPIAGDKSHFQGVIDSVTQKFTMFLEKGIPVRATLSIKISEFKTLEQQVKPTPKSSSDRTKHRIFSQGDSIWLWANNEYGNPDKWRYIALANKIDNPRLIAPGTEITIPPLD